MSTRAPADLDALISQRERIWSAQFALARGTPTSSARRLVSTGAFSAVVAALAALGLVTVLAPLVTAVALYLAVALLALSSDVHRSSGALLARLRPAPLRVNWVGVVRPCTVLVPLRDEVPAVAGLVESLRALRSASSRVEVLFVVDDADLATIGEVERAISGVTGLRLVTVPTTDHRAPATALNYALHEARGDLLVVVAARHGLDAATFLEAVDRLSSGDASLATVVVPPAVSRSPANLIAAWNELGREHPCDPIVQTDAVVIHRAAAVVAAGAWDPFNCDPSIDLRIRLQREGWTEDVLPARCPVAARADLIETIGRRASTLAGAWQVWMVDNRARSARSVRTPALSAALPSLGARLPLAALRPVLVVVSVLLVARPQATAGFVDAFPGWTYPVALSTAIAAAAAYGWSLVRGARRGALPLVAAILTPLWSLADACSAVKAVVLLVGGARAATARAAAVPTPIAATTAVGRA